MKILMNEAGMSLIEVMVAGLVTIVIALAGATVVSQLMRQSEWNKTSSKAYEKIQQITLDLRNNSL